MKGCAPPTRIGSGNPANVGNVLARDMSCRSVRRAIENGYLVASGGFRTGGFYCYIISRSIVPGVLVTGATNRCVAGHRAFRFDWAT